MDKIKPKYDSLAETQNYTVEDSSDYHVIEEQILVPIAENKRTIMLISQMVSGHYGAHG